MNTSIPTSLPVEPAASLASAADSGVAALLGALSGETPNGDTFAALLPAGPVAAPPASLAAASAPLGEGFLSVLATAPTPDAAPLAPGSGPGAEVAVPAGQGSGPIARSLPKPHALPGVVLSRLAGAGLRPGLLKVSSPGPESPVSPVAAATGGEALDGASPASTPPTREQIEQALSLLAPLWQALTSVLAPQEPPTSDAAPVAAPAQGAMTVTLSLPGQSPRIATLALPGASAALASVTDRLLPSGEAGSQTQTASPAVAPTEASDDMTGTTAPMTQPASQMAVGEHPSVDAALPAPTPAPIPAATNMTASDALSPDSAPAGSASGLPAAPFSAPAGIPALATPAPQQGTYAPDRAETSLPDLAVEATAGTSAAPAACALTLRLPGGAELSLSLPSPAQTGLLPSNPDVGQGRPENNAGQNAEAVRGNSALLPPAEKQFLNPPAEEVIVTAKTAGITGAKKPDAMPQLANNPRRFTSSSMPEPVPVRSALVELVSVSPAPAAAVISHPASTAMPAAVAHRAVEAVMAIVDSQRNQPAQGGLVNLSFRIGQDDLTVRVQLRAGLLQAQFRTDSPELRAALATEWRSTASSAASGNLRLAEPEFVPASSASSFSPNGFAQGQPGSHQHAQQQAPGNPAMLFPELRGLRRGASAPAVPSETAESRPVAAYAPHALHLTAVA